MRVYFCKKSVHAVFLPLQGISAHIQQGFFGFPSEESLCFFRIRIVARNVAFAARSNLIGNRQLVGCFKYMNNVQNAVSDTRTKIDNLTACVLLAVIICSNMTFCKIDNMDIITDTCSVRCRIIIAEYGQMTADTRRHLRDIWHQIVRDSVRIFADQARFMRTDRIKITQQNHRQFRISFDGILKNLLIHKLCPAARICTAEFIIIFRIRHFIRFAVNRCR